MFNYVIMMSVGFILLQRLGDLQRLPTRFLSCIAQPGGYRLRNREQSALGLGMRLAIGQLALYIVIGFLKQNNSRVLL